MLTFTMDEAGRFAVDVVEVDPATWKRLRLRVEHDDGFWIDVELLRSPEWIAQHVSDDGRHVWLDMPEVGVVGIARVEAIEPCPPIAEGPGRVVTSTFKHRLGTVYDLRVAGEEKAIGTTPTHPFWSVDREQWIPAVELRPGERLKTWTGFSTVESIEPRPEPEPVYNIEVEGDHVYRVGASGVLVHNNSVPGCVNNRSGSVDYGDFDNWGVELTTSDHYAGRPEGVHAFITPNHGTGSGAQTYLVPPGWNNLPMGILRARGHLLGRQLGGSGREPLNIVALHRAANSPAMVTCENRIVDALNCECVEVWITPIYDQNSGEPEAIRIRAVGDRGIFRLDVRIENVANAQTPSTCVQVPNSS